MQQSDVRAVELNALWTNHLGGCEVMPVRCAFAITRVGEGVDASFEYDSDISGCNGSAADRSQRSVPSEGATKCALVVHEVAGGRLSSHCSSVTF